MRSDVVALYVDPRGPYPSLVHEWYDEKRDARTYAGPYPVVAHPPCGPWSTLRTLSREKTKWCAQHALEQVRRCGGILEHPRGSKFFEHAGLPRPGHLPDKFGGFTIEVAQCDWGHVARKLTWLYCMGVRTLPRAPKPNEPTHWSSGVHTPGARGKPPTGIKICSAEQRRRTPPAFAAWLLELAAQANRRAA